jgi:hypothetical protein
MINVQDLNGRVCNFIKNDIRQTWDNELAGSRDSSNTAPGWKEIKGIGSVEQRFRDSRGRRLVVFSNIKGDLFEVLRGRCRPSNLHPF